MVQDPRSSPSLCEEQVMHRHGPRTVKRLHLCRTAQTTASLDCIHRDAPFDSSHRRHHAYPFGRAELISLRRFYLRNVLMHEVGHHLDTGNLTRKDRERFAEQFAERHG